MQRLCILYQHDLIDIARQYLSELFNYRMGKLYRAFKSGDKKIFNAQAGELLSILESIESIISTDEFYHMKPLIERLKKTPGAAEDVDARLKEEYTVWDRTAPSDWLVDYTRRDYYETVKFYYKPRMKALISSMRDNLEKGIREIKFSEVVHTYKQIEYTFVDKPLQSRQYQKYPGTTQQAVKEALAKHKISKGERIELEQAEKTAQKIVQKPLDIDWDDMASFEGIG